MNKLIVLSLFSLLFSCTEGYRYPYQDTKLDFESRAEDLVSRMTLAEKVSQLTHYADAVEHLGIPEYNWWNECLHGVARSGKATVFPQAIGMAATFDRDMMFRMADVTSTEARAKYHDYIAQDKHGMYQGLTFWSPNINIFRDPRWGRGHETYGEDPYLSGEMGVEFVRIAPLCLERFWMQDYQLHHGKIIHLGWVIMSKTINQVLMQQYFLLHQT